MSEQTPLEPLLETSVEDYLALRYADDPVKAFDLFIKAWVSPTYHGHLLDNDENDGQFVRDHIERVQEALARFCGAEAAYCECAMTNGDAGQHRCRECGTWPGADRTAINGEGRQHEDDAP